MEENILVSIKCAVYNHGPYLRQCLDGLVNQKTTFRYEVIVHDDASVDDSPEIITEYARKYPNIIIPILETENQYSKKDGSLSKIIDNACSGKYYAYCEGDDYWIDEYKLQRQVDFLENNPEYILCHTGFKIYDETNNNYIDCSDIINKNIIIGNSNIDYEILNSNNYRIQTMSVLFRREAYKKIEPRLLELKSQFLMGDTPLWIFLHQLGYFYFDPTVTSVYRVHVGSASRLGDQKAAMRFQLSCCELSFFLSHNIGLSNKEIRFFQNRYLKCLVKYKILEPSYQPFLNDYISSKILKVAYIMFIREPFLSIFRPLYKSYLKHANKSRTYIY